MTSHEPDKAATWQHKRYVAQQLWSERQQELVIAWAESEPAIRGVALVGSWARGEARLDSDIDLLFLVTEPARFRDFAIWPPELRPDETAAWRDAVYGVVWSRHIQTRPNLEAEYTFAPLSWADTAPVDPGTARVIRDGCRILVDPDGRLARLAAAVGG